MTSPVAISTRVLVDRLAHGDPDGVITLGDLLDQFSERSFGMFLMLALIPNFLPIPVGVGAISGALIVLIGVQLLFHVQHPWLPRWLARREIHRSTLVGFRNHLDKWLGRIERLVKPRALGVLDHPVGHAFSGLMLVALGAILALPILGTNWLFGMLLLGYSFALIERDGRLMLLCWALGLAEIVTVVFFSAQLIAWTAWLAAVVHRWFT
jgi:hypothetical protein